MGGGPNGSKGPGPDDIGCLLASCRQLILLAPDCARLILERKAKSGDLKNKIHVSESSFFSFIGLL
jgi:hypothetical protein